MADSGRTVFGSSGGETIPGHHQTDPGYMSLDSTPGISAGGTLTVDLSDGGSNANGADAPGIDCETSSFTPSCTAAGLFLYTIKGGASGPISVLIRQDQHELEVESGNTQYGGANTFVTQFVTVQWPNDQIGLFFKNVGGSPVTDAFCELFVTRIV